MSEKKYSRESRLKIAHRHKMTITIDEFERAFIEDIRALKEQINIAYVSGAYLTICTTNEASDAPENRSRK